MPKAQSSTDSCNGKKTNRVHENRRNTFKIVFATAFLSLIHLSSNDVDTQSDMKAPFRIGRKEQSPSQNTGFDRVAVALLTKQPVHMHDLSILAAHLSYLPGNRTSNDVRRKFFEGR